MYRRVVFWSGIALVSAGVVVGLRIPYFYLHNHFTSQSLIAQAQALVSSSQFGSNSSSTNSSSRLGANSILVTHSSKTGATGTPSGGAANVTMIATIPLANPPAGDVLGLLDIPKLGLTAPVLQGTGDIVLNVGVGHLPSSAALGQPSIAVLAAHNATWFRHIDQLIRGDTLQVQTASGTYIYKVVSHTVVKTGDAVAETAASALVLESCYPLDALYTTPYRYLVRANLVQVRTATSTGQAREQASGQSRGQQVASVVVTASVPKNLADEGLLVHQNAVPLGHLMYSSSTSTAFAQSAAPLAVTNAMTQLFNAYVHASEDSNSADLEALGLSASIGNVARVNPLFGTAATQVTYVRPLEFRLHVAGIQLQTVMGTAGITIDGQTWTMQLKAIAVRGAGLKPAEQRYMLKLTSVSFY